ncbi:MAG: methyltransferase domain-containing protein [Chloroflexi bacterium]|nr:methyltransferase domain-containing protein [Chloroflexota bacterium]
MDETAAVKRELGHLAEGFAASRVHAKGSDLAKLLEVIDPTGTERVLDLATGVGHTALALAPRVASVVGLDMIPEMLEHARRLARDRRLTNVEFVEGPAEQVPFPAASFQVVTCRLAAHHFADPARAFAEVARVLLPGGRFLLADNYAPDSDELDHFINTLDRERDPSHVREYRLGEWQALFEQHGMSFQVADVWETANDFEVWVHQTRMPGATEVALRRMLVEASPAERQAFHITTAPEFAFCYLKAMMVGIRRKT